MYLTNKGLLANARRILAITVSGGCLFLQFLQAADTVPVLPSNGVYVAGSGAIKASGNAVTINQSTLRGVIDWTNFSIGQGGMVTFKNGSGATLNRVTGSQMSSILGSLFASGSVYLINPQGVLIGPNAHVHTGGDFVASTLSVSPDAFMQGGSLVLQGDSKNVVVNLGDLFSSNGSVFLIGHDVSNSGSIRAANGTAGLAAASQVLIKDSTGDQRIFVQVPAGDVTNSGNIQAAQAELKAKGGNIYALAGNNSVIAATGTANIDGKVWLIADGGKTTVASSVLAQNASGVGGAIETSGRSLDISQASIKTGQHGNWLLDPDDQTIDSSAATVIETSLATTNVTISTSATVASGPGTATTGNGDINLNSSIGWSSSNSFNVSAYRDINVATGVTLSNSGAGNLTLRADNTSNGTGTVNLNGTSMIDWSGSTGTAAILYNPAEPVSPGVSPIRSPLFTPLTSAAAYGNPTDYSSHILTNSAWTAPTDHTVSNQVTAYMLVNNGTDLANVPNSGNFALGKDIDISSNSNFTELGKTAPGFTGIFDGFGHTINGLTMSTNDNPLGMFQYLGASGIIRNVNLTEMSVTETSGGTGEFGGLVGESSGTIANVTATGSLYNLNAPFQTGGIVGFNTSSGLIYNVQAHVNVDETTAQDPNTSAAVGGLVGVSHGTIINSTSSGAVTTNGFSTGSGQKFLGGLAGINNGTITNSSSSGNVFDPNGENTYAGGLIGDNTNGILTDVSASGNVTAYADSEVWIGGLIGYNPAPLSNVHATGSITTGINAQAGGLVGHSDGAIDSSYATGAVTTLDGDHVGGLVGFMNAPITNSYASGNVTAGANSNVGGLTGWSYVNTISGSHATGNILGGDGSLVGGLAGRIDGAVDNSYATGTVSGGVGSNTGGLVGSANSTITESHAAGDVYAGDGSNLGGLAGSSNGAVSGSHATGAVSGTSSINAGGLIGNASGTIDNSYATGSLDLGDYSSVGGLVGTTWANITNSYAEGTVSGGYSNRIGGLAGYTNALVDSSHASGNVYDLGAGGGGNYVGGLIGLVDNGGSVSNSHAFGSVTSQGPGTVGGLVGLLAGTATTSTASGVVSSGDYSFVGGLFGEADTALSGFTATNNVSAGTWSQAGGLVGHMLANIDTSTASGNVSANWGSNVGGLVANTVADITNSSASGTVTGGGDNFAGGLVGYSNGAVSGSQATGNVTGFGDGGTNSLGGLIGYLETGGSVTNSQALGTVTASGLGGNLGGLVGTANSTIVSSHASGAVMGSASSIAGGLAGVSSSTISSSFAIGDVINGDNSQSGGLVGNTSGAVTDSYAHGSVSAGTGGLTGGLIGYTSASVSNGTATGNVTTSGGVNSATGGLIGRDDSSSSVSGSTASGQVESEGSSGSVGGLIGLSYAPVTTSSASGSVTTGDGAWIGGLIGESHGTIDNSTASGAVTGTANVSAGGLVGNSSADITASNASGVVIAGSSSNAGGLVGYTWNLVDTSYATGAVSAGQGSYVGGLIGYANGTVTNANASGNVTLNTGGGAAGGLIGWVDTSGSVANAQASGTVTATGGYGSIGGLVGLLKGPLSSSSATGSVTGGDYAWVGGMVGEAHVALDGFTSSVNVTAGNESDAGGLVGYTNSAITNSTASGTVSGGNGAQAGGLVGVSVVDSANNALVNSSASGNVFVGSSGTAGGLGGYVGGMVSNSFATGQVQGGDLGDIGGLIGWASGPVDSSYATGRVTTGNASIANTWGASSGGGLIGYTDATNTITNSHASGTVTGGDYSTVGGLVGFANGTVSESYATGTVTAGIAASGGGLIGIANGAISDSNASGNITVGSGIDWNSAPPNPGAFAGGLVGQTANNATITNSYATGNIAAGDFSYVGGLAGWTAPPVTGSYATGMVTGGGSADVGGLVGGNLSSISNSYATGNVIGADNSYVGGLVGDASATIESSYATGNVSAGTSATADAGCGGCTTAGGLVGNTYKAISTSFATGNVSALGVGAWAGGLVGTDWSGADINQSYATGQVSASGANAIAGGFVGSTQSAVIDSYATGAVNATGSGSIAGGLVGLLNVGTVDPPATPSISSSYSIGAVSGADTMGGLVGLNESSENITSSFWDMTTSGQATSAGGIGLTTSQWLVMGPVATEEAAWDLNNTWVAGYPYPVLRAFPYVVANLATDGHRIYGQADPGITITSATDQNSNDALSSIQGTLIPVTVGRNTHVGTYLVGGSGQTVPNHQLTYLGYETIDPLAIVLGGNGVNNKTYDGTINTTLSPDGFYVANLVGSDNVMVSTSTASALFDNKNVGNGKAVDVTGLTLTGPDAANYIVSNSYQATASVTPATLTATFTANSKVYDGTTTATASVSGLNGVIGADSVSVQNGSFDFASKNAGGVNPVSASNYVLTGPDAGNYVVTFVQNGSAAITPATLYYVGQAGTNRPFGADNPAFTGTVTGFVGGDTLASTTTGSPVFSTNATTMSNVGSYALYGSGLTLTTGNYTLAQAPGNDTAFTINPITISIGNVNRFVGSANPPFTISYSGPMTPYLQSLLSSLVLVTNAPASDTAGTYQINALIPAELAGDIIVNPGALNILSNINNSINPATPQSISTLPSALSTQTVLPPFPLPAVGGSTSGNAVMPTNANGIFQIVINPSPDWTASSANQTQGGTLSTASFTEKSPDGHTKKKNSIYPVGAH